MLFDFKSSNLRKESKAVLMQVCRAHNKLKTHYDLKKTSEFTIVASLPVVWKLQKLQFQVPLMLLLIIKHNGSHDIFKNMDFIDSI